MNKSIRNQLLTTSVIFAALTGPAYAGPVIDSSSITKAAVLNAKTGVTTTGVTGATIAVSGNGTSTTINQTAAKIDINWSNFSSAANESIKFVQPNANSIAINRVTSGKQSMLLGSLDANGRIVILNDAGVVFGAGSQTNVAALTASTAKTFTLNSNGTYTATDFSGNKVVVQGTINTPSGYVFLLAKEVDVNSGAAINASKGTVDLEAGAATYTVNLTSAGNITYTTDKLDSGIVNVNTGSTVSANSGNIIVKTQANQIANATMNLSGVVDVTNFKTTTGGKTTTSTTAGSLTASSDGNLTAGGLLESGTGNIALTSSNNINLNNTTITGNAVTLAARNNVQTIAGTSTVNSTGATNITGDLYANNGGNLNVNAGTTLGLNGTGGTTPVIGNGNINLTSKGNTTLTKATIGGGNTTITAGGTTSFDNITTDNLTSYAANLDIAFKGDTSISQSIFSKNGGTINLHTNGKLTYVHGRLDSGTGQISLNSVGDADISAIFNGNNIAVTSQGDVTLRQIDSGTTNAAITSGGNTYIKSLTNGGNYTINSAHPLVLDSNTTIYPGQPININSVNDVTINGANFTGTFNANITTQGNLNLTGSNTTTAKLGFKATGAVNLNGSLNVTNGGNYTIESGQPLYLGSNAVINASPLYSLPVTFIADSNATIDGAHFNGAVINVSSANYLNLLGMTSTATTLNLKSAGNTNIMGTSTINPSAYLYGGAVPLNIQAGGQVNMVPTTNITGTGPAVISAAGDINLNQANLNLNTLTLKSGNNITSTGTNTVASGTNLNLTGNIFLNDSGTFNATATQALTLTGTNQVLTGQTGTINLTSVNTTINNASFNGNLLNITSQGNLILNGMNSYAEGSNISSTTGTINITNSLFSGDTNILRAAGISINSLTSSASNLNIGAVSTNSKTNLFASNITLINGGNLTGFADTVTLPDGAKINTGTGLLAFVASNALYLTNTSFSGNSVTLSALNSIGTYGLNSSLANLTMLSPNAVALNTTVNLTGNGNLIVQADKQIYLQTQLNAGTAMASFTSGDKISLGTTISGNTVLLRAGGAITGALSSSASNLNIAATNINLNSTILTNGGNLTAKAPTIGGGNVDTGTGLLAFINDGDLAVSGSFSGKSVTLSSGGNLTANISNIATSNFRTVSAGNTGINLYGNGVTTQNIAGNINLQAGQQLTLSGTYNTGTDSVLVNATSTTGTKFGGRLTGNAFDLSTSDNLTVTQIQDSPIRTLTLTSSQDVNLPASVSGGIRTEGNLAINAGGKLNVLNDISTVGNLALASAGDITVGDFTKNAYATIGGHSVTATTSAGNINLNYGYIGGIDNTIINSAGAITVSKSIMGEASNNVALTAKGDITFANAGVDTGVYYGDNTPSTYGNLNVTSTGGNVILNNGSFIVNKAVVSAAKSITAQNFEIVTTSKTNTVSLSAGNGIGNLTTSWTQDLQDFDANQYVFKINPTQ